MIIAIDLTAVGSTGTMGYSSGFISALEKIDHENEYIIFCSTEAYQLFKNNLNKDRFKFIAIFSAKKVFRRIIFGQLILPLLLLKYKVNVVFSAFDIAPLMSPCPVLLGVRNPLPILLKNGYFSNNNYLKKVRANMHKILTLFSSRVASKIIYPTKYAAIAIGEALKIPENKQLVVHHGIDYKFWSTDSSCEAHFIRLGLMPNEYILFVSEFYPYKKPQFLINEFSLYLKKRHRKNIKLVMVGKIPDRAFSDYLNQLVIDLKIEEYVIFPGHITKDELRSLYRNAALFALPSEMETFGFPYIEAMLSGAPIIAADKEFAKELCGEAALYCSLEIEGSMSSLISVLLNDSNVRDSLVRFASIRSKDFSWELEAEETLRAILNLHNPSEQQLMCGNLK